MSDNLKSRDWRDVEKPNLRTRDVLMHLVAEDLMEFTSGYVSRHFNVKPSDASMRIKRLEQWGCIKKCDPRKKWGCEYNVTDWGREMAVKWAKEEVGEK
jgi:DNA-binding MarR family transcriptional regulator